MRLRTLPLSLAGVVCGSVVALRTAPASVCLWATLVFLYLTTVSLQILSNMSNELGDYLSGVDSADREGPNYSLAEGDLSEQALRRAIGVFRVLCCVFGVVMVFSSWPLRSWVPWLMLVVGAAAVWAATHYTLGKNPYGYRGLGDIFVFIFFGLVSVVGAYFVVAHSLASPVWLVGVGCGLLSIGVLNVNNIRDIDSDRGHRVTIPILIGVRWAKIYHTLLILLGYLCYLLFCPHWAIALMCIPFIVHLVGVWHFQGHRLDPMLPLLVLSTFILSLMASLLC